MIPFVLIVCCATSLKYTVELNKVLQFLFCLLCQYLLTVACIFVHRVEFFGDSDHRRHSNYHNFLFVIYFRNETSMCRKYSVPPTNQEQVN